MIPDSPFDDRITSDDDFESTLEELLLAAVENGIELEGSWVFRPDGNGRDFEVMVYELEIDESE